MESHELPAPDDVARAHSDQLVNSLKSRIASAGGVVSFADYMQHVLYEPGLGYYMAGAEKFGAAGDFITAPEVSVLFGQCLAVQIDEILKATPDAAGVLELGAGSGKLSLSVLNQLQSNTSLQYFILEPSADLQQRQRHLLHSSLSSEVFDRVTWLSELPASFNGVIIANEVMDALAVERFSVGSETVQQVCVSENLQQVMRPAHKQLAQAVANIEKDIAAPLAEGYTSEYCAALPSWIKALATSLGTGVMLLIDYGYPRREYYSEERNAGTLACYYRHRTHADPYYLPGLQDITAHVDFTAVAESALHSGLDLLGYATQSAFLLDNELLSLADAMAITLDREQDRILLMKQVKTLTLPGEMGERFQVMALGKGYDHALRGFNTQDLSYRL